MDSVIPTNVQLGRAPLQRVSQPDTFEVGAVPRKVSRVHAAQRCLLPRRVSFWFEPVQGVPVLCVCVFVCVCLRLFVSVCVHVCVC